MLSYCLKWRVTCLNLMQLKKIYEHVLLPSCLFMHTHTLTWPEMESIKAIGVEVVTHPIASPPLTTTGVRCVTTGVGPTHPKVSGFCRDKWENLIHNQLVVPLSVLSRPITDSQEDVGTYAVGRRDCDWFVTCWKQQHDKYHLVGWIIWSIYSEKELDFSVGRF